MNASTQTATQTPARADRRKSVVDPREHRFGGEQSTDAPALAVGGFLGAQATQQLLAARDDGIGVVQRGLPSTAAARRPAHVDSLGTACL